jgi:hypothetical protein
MSATPLLTSPTIPFQDPLPNLEPYESVVEHSAVGRCQELILLLYRVSRRNVSDFGMVFLMLKYTDITQNTYV